MKALTSMLSESFKERHRWRWWKLQRHFSRPPLPQNADGKVYVHLGCGKANDSRFINVDAMPWPHVHYVCGVERLPMLSDGSVDLIYASHCLEHLGFLEVPAVLCEWRRTLRQGGWLRLSVPDFDLILAIYLDNARNVEAIEPTLFGGQTYAFNFHKSVYNKSHLASLLTRAGFGNVREWQPGNHEPTPFADWSGKTVAIGEKRYPVSLNLEAQNMALAH